MYLLWTFVFVVVSANLIDRQEREKRSVCDQLPWLKNVPPDQPVSVPGLVVNGINVDGSDCRAPPQPIASDDEEGRFIVGNTPVTNVTPTPQVGCPYGLKGVVLNGGYKPDDIDKIADADSWLDFGLSLTGPASLKAMTSHIPMMAFASDVQQAIQLLKSATPPAYLLTFNEPDHSYFGTPVMTAQQAASAIAPLIAAKINSTTRLVAPALANHSSSWLSDFFAACGCKESFYAYSMHVFTPDLNVVHAEVAAFRARFNDKPLWITELAVANAQCSLSWNLVGQYMNKVYSWAHNAAPYVERIFWNSGNQLNNGDTNVCNSYLLNAQDGSPSPLLPVYQQMICSGPFI